jgi:FkbM family methyltransferase
MLINFNRLPNDNIKGVIHIGAHLCEEKTGYNNYFKLNDDKIIWIEALKEKVDYVKNNIDNNILIFNECMHEVDNKIVSFMVTNNYQSSSVLNLKTHLQQHPHVYETNRIKMTTKTLKTFYEENSLNVEDYNFMNLDIQGAELLALRGAGDILKYFDYIYAEVNVEELYEDCCLMHDVDEYLSTFGFKRVITELTQYGWGDALYIKDTTI